MQVGYECEFGIFRSLLWGRDSRVAPKIPASWCSLVCGWDTLFDSNRWNVAKEMGCLRSHVRSSVVVLHKTVALSCGVLLALKEQAAQSATSLGKPT